MDFTGIEYLNNGNEKQRLAYNSLMKYAVMEKLRQFTPVLVGTIPIEIDIETSDLDIVCCWQDKNEFIEKVKQSFHNEESFCIYEKEIRGTETVIARFNIEHFEVEVFGQNIPVTGQAGYRHMLAEYSILKEKGEKFRRQVIRLKKQGIKTEPAFARLLQLQGDAYQELLLYMTKEK